MARLGVAAAVVLILAAGCGGDTAGVEAFCDAERELFEADKTVAEDPEGYLDALQEVRDEAPEEIVDEINLEADLTEEALETGDFSILQSEEYLAVEEEITAYLDENCEAPEE